MDKVFGIQHILIKPNLIGICNAINRLRLMKVWINFLVTITCDMHFNVLCASEYSLYTILYSLNNIQDSRSYLNNYLPSKNNNICIHSRTKFNIYIRDVHI